MSPETCAPLRKLCPCCGEETLYKCGRSVLSRDPTDPAQACPSGQRGSEGREGPTGLQICIDCVDEVGNFFQRAYDARAVRMEHKADI